MENRPQPDGAAPQDSLSSIATEWLLHHHREGDKRAIDKLFFRVRRSLMAEIRDHPSLPFLPSTHGVEDVLQDLWLVLFDRRSLDSFEDRGEGSLRAYLRRCLDYKMLDICRRGSAAKRGGDIPHQPLEANSSVGAEAVPAIAPDPGPATVAERGDWQDRCIRLLSGQDREVWRLRFVDDLGYVAIAARLGTTESAVRSAYHRAIERLHKSGVLKMG